jgi:hypothetical protein
VTTPPVPLADVPSEAERVVDGLAARGVVARLLGGTGVAAHQHGPVPAVLQRAFADIDLVTGRKSGRALADGLAALGYAANDRFNALHGARRLLFYDTVNQRQLDVFVGEFAMCHRLGLDHRLNQHPRALAPADLLLTKLQIVEINHKDIVDVAAIVHQHEVGDHDDDTVNAGYIAKLLAGDWGLWRTSRGTVENVQAQLSQLDLDAADLQLIEARLALIWARVEEEPKSLRWRARARIGDRSRWYDEPEEIAHARQADRG